MIQFDVTSTSYFFTYVTDIRMSKQLVLLSRHHIYVDGQVQVGNETRRTYALKQMKKHHIVETHQQEHVLNEKWTMIEARSDFIIRYRFPFLCIS